MRVNRAPETNRALVQPPNGYCAKDRQVYGLKWMQFRGDFFMPLDSFC